MFIDYNNNSFIKGTGIDMTDIRRYKKMRPEIRERLSKKILTDDELSLYERSPNQIMFLAKTFCAKECVAKCLGTGFNGIGFQDIRIDKDTFGKPIVLLSSKASKVADMKSITEIHLAITHEKNYVVCQSTAS